jgi:flagellar basal-body rod modification protein FlgD
MQLDPLRSIHGAAATSTSATTSASSGSAASAPQQSTISITDFMQLLSAEMANQDPLQPMDPTQTMTQLAQFTTLQQTTALAQTQSLATGNSYIGAQVTVTTGAGQAPVTGTVTAVDTSGVASGTPPELVLNDSTQEFPLSAITLVQYPAATSTGTTSGGTTTPASGGQ